MRIYKHTSLLTYLRQEYCLIWEAGGVGGLGGDATGVGNPLDELENPSDDLGNRSYWRGWQRPASSSLWKRMKTATMARFLWSRRRSSLLRS